ncbi:arginase family protein [Mycolicibacterium novocastrense]|uniref:Arginase family hydrolase n=1 Tax=Mycolicibacterium novocastrense TaxID=59813 RepID=A0AAW5SF57_MYCNV|nr:arginase family protein [Mycolicibacterium novocastrense]MCV7022305.1 arginase family protein [Mycolicibacterium novocastrense]GAT10013.1 arginase family hydrolase [Mycolicibacterium novocastrense]
MSFAPSAEEAVHLLEGYFYWSGFPKLLGCEIETDFTKADIALVGLPLAVNPVERTQYLGPRAVRHRSQAYHRGHREFGINPFELARIRDFGDVPIPTPTLADQAVLDIEMFYARMDAAGVLPFTIGGDHACTLPVLRAIAGPNSRRKGPIGIIHFDSHTDTYGDSAGVHCHAGNGFRIGNEEGLIDASRYVHVGLNGPMVHPNMDDYSKEAGYRLLSLDEIEEIGIPAATQEIRKVVGDGPVYVTVDLDVLTLSDAPAVADPEAGGLTIREMLRILRSFRGMDIVGGDVVCFVPHLDPSQITALHISAIMHEIVTMMAEGVAKKR